MADLWDGVTYEAFLATARLCRTRAEFERSDFFARHGEELRAFLLTPWIRSDWARPSDLSGPADPPRAADPSRPSEPSRPADPARSADPYRPADPSRPADPARSAGSALPGLRVVQWNIEKGLQLDRIRRRLTEDPELAAADVYCLNEVDVGMARSGSNADVGAELAQALGCHLVYLPSYIECTKGPGPDALAPGENERGLHGLAILSRHPVREARGSALPACWDYFDYPVEKRYGVRQVLRARIDWNGQDILVATTHLEVRNVPACRASQMAAVLRALEQDRVDWGPRGLPTVLTGDFNTNTFRRGGLAHTIREFLRIVRTPPSVLASELAAPYAREPLFRMLGKAGFAYEPYTDGRWTAETLLGSAEDLDVLPRPLADYVSRTFGLGSRFIQMRLDWIVASGFSPATPPRTVTPEESPRKPASDHWIITADLVRDESVRSGRPEAVRV